jgi:hypothetical protein
MFNVARRHAIFRWCELSQEKDQTTERLKLQRARHIAAGQKIPPGRQAAQRGRPVQRVENEEQPVVRGPALGGLDAFGKIRQKGRHASVGEQGVRPPLGQLRRQVCSDIDDAPCAPPCDW